MPIISLTDFVDFAAASGTPRITKVRQIKARGKYERRSDFYRSIRLQIIECQRTGQNPANLRDFVETQREKDKLTLLEIVHGYERVASRLIEGWLIPPHSRWAHGELEVIVNPELGTFSGGQLHMLKLYFKKNPLSKFKVGTINHVMSVALGEMCADATAMGILDLRRSKIVLPDTKVSDLGALLAGEAEAFITMWNSIGI